MINKLVVTIITLAYASNIFGQDSNIPDSVRAMIDRSQAGTQFEQTARMQINVQFGLLLESLSGDAMRKNQIESKLVEILTERARLSAEVNSGRVSPEELKAISNHAYLRNQLAPLLNPIELSVLDSQTNGPSDAQLKQDYAAELARSAGSLREERQELVLDVLVKHARMSANDSPEPSELNIDDLVAQQNRMLMHAHQELEALFSTDEMQLINIFMNQLQVNLYRLGSMDSEHTDL
ncbi:MAG: hypothetical protein P8N40_09315 [Gammaproteobacteria bacterium]|nr:hypothetical protein [Gammaproteobacteria bacterium]